MHQAISFKHHPRAKRITLRVRPDGTVQATLPPRMKQQDALRYIHSQQNWIDQQQKRQPAAVAIIPDITLSVLGETRRFRLQPGRGSHLNEKGEVIIGGDAHCFARRVKRWISQQARCIWHAEITELTQQTNTSFRKLSLTDTISRWGSCSHEGNIRLQWRLALAPKEVASYVVAHEVAHLTHFDHSPAFWELVSSLHPHYQSQKEWLKQHGRSLHAYEF